MNKINLIAIIGKSGSGKDTLLKRIISTLDQKEKLHNGNFNEKYHHVIPFTSRPKRIGEKNGRDYWFVSDEEVGQYIQNDKIMQLSIFNDWYYGFTCNDFVDDRINIGIFSPQAVEHLSDFINFNIQTFYLDSSDKIRVMRQLRRASDDKEVKEIVRRYQTDADDFSENELSYLPNLTKLKNDTWEDHDHNLSYISRLMTSLSENS